MSKAVTDGMAPALVEVTVPLKAWKDTAYRVARKSDIAAFMLAGTLRFRCSTPRTWAGKGTDQRHLADRARG